MVVYTMISTFACALILVSPVHQEVIPSTDSVFDPIWRTNIADDAPISMSNNASPHPAAMHRRFLLEKADLSTSYILESTIISSLRDRGIYSDDGKRVSASCKVKICEITIVNAWNPSIDYSSAEAVVARSIDHVARNYNLRQMTIIRSEIIKERGRSFLVYLEKI